MEDDEASKVSPEITRLSTFPFGSGETTGTSLDVILNHLPPQPRAWSLYETYAEHVSWLFGPVKRDEMIDDILSPIYKATKENQTFGSNPLESLSPHKSAVLFFVFAMGALVDLTLEPCELLHHCLPGANECLSMPFTSDSTESETYYHLGCACLSLRSVFDSPEIHTVQAVFLMAAFHIWGGKKHTMDSAVGPQIIVSGIYVTFPLSGL